MIRSNARLVRALLITLLVLALGNLAGMIAGGLSHIANFVIVTIFSVLFAYAIYPPVRALVKRGLPIALAGPLVYIALFVVVIGAIAWIAPAIAVQAADLVQNIPHFIAAGQAQMANPQSSPLLGHLPQPVRVAIAANAGKVGQITAGFAGAFGTHAVELASGTTTVIINITLVLGLALLFMGEASDIRLFILRCIPASAHKTALGFIDDIDDVIASFVRGQLVLALTVAVVGTLALLILGVPYSLLLGVIAGALNVIPAIGLLIALLPIAIITFVTVGLLKTVIAVIIFGVMFQAQQMLVPLIFSKTVGVTPLVLFAALLIGSETAGVLGMLLSIPVAGILRAATDRFLPRVELRDRAIVDPSVTLHKPGAP